MPEEKTDSEPIEKEDADKVEDKKKVEPTLKNQLFGIVVLIAVFGILWLITKGMGPLGEFLGDGISKTIKDGATKVEAPDPAAAGKEGNLKAVPAGKEKSLEPDFAKQIPIETAPATPLVEESLPIPAEFVREQMIESLGGPSAVEVRFLAFSDDEKRLITSVKLTEEGKEPKLTEILFERDEFGRYLSTEDSPVDIPIKIWPR